MADSSCVLFVQKESLSILQNLSYLSEIYSLANSCYPDITSLYLTSSPVQDFIKSGKLELYSVEVFQ